MKNQLKDMVSPEVRNILDRYRRLSFLINQMGINIPADKNSHDVFFILEKIENYKSHKHYKEVVDLCNKLTKINKK